jgi:hypothetical protein
VGGIRAYRMVRPHLPVQLSWPGARRPMILKDGVLAEVRRKPEAIRTSTSPLPPDAH